MRDSPHKSAFVKGFKLTAREKRDLIMFLRSLTDESFLRDPRFNNPWSQQQITDVTSGEARLEGVRRQRKRRL